MRMRAIAVSLLVVSSTAASAQAPERGRDPRPAAAGERGSSGRLGPLFRGIQLTEAERAGVRAVHEKYRPQLQTVRRALQPLRREAAEARRRGDTTALQALRARAETQRGQTRKLLEQMRGELRAALTPEHRTRFDANLAQFAAEATDRATARSLGEQRGRRMGRGAMRRGAMGRGAMGRGAMGRGVRGPGLARLQLTEPERQRIQQVRTKYQPQLKTAREALRPELAAVREARQRGDTAGARAAWQRAATRRAALQSLREQLRVEVRAALTPEHRQQLDSLRLRGRGRPAGMGRPPRG